MPDNTITDPAEAVNAMIRSAIAIGETSSLADVGMGLLFGLAVIAVSWSAILTIMSGDGIQKIVSDYVMIAITWGIAAWFIVGVGPTGKPLSTTIMEGFDYLSNTVLSATTGASGASDPANQIAGVIRNTIIAASNIFDVKAKIPAVSNPTPADVPEMSGP